MALVIQVTTTLYFEALQNQRLKLKCFLCKVLFFFFSFKFLTEPNLVEETAVRNVRLMDILEEMILGTI